MRSIKSSTGYAETVSRLTQSVARRDLVVFAQFDHGVAARDVGMELADEVVVVFGNPRAGTPLMQLDPRIGIELPLRVLVWDDGAGTTVGYKDPRDLADAYDVGRQAETLEAMSSLLEQLAQEAAGKA